MKSDSTGKITVGTERSNNDDPDSGSGTYDLFIIGAGPAGLTASMFAKLKGLTVKLVDGLAAGGQLRNLYPHKPVFNYPGYGRINAGELAGKMLDQVRNEGIPVNENTPVQNIICTVDGRYVIETPEGQYRSRTVLLACGMGLFMPRKLAVPGEEEAASVRLFYSIGDISSWRGLQVAVIGGGNSALDNALLLTQQECRVMVIHQFMEFQADKATVMRLEPAGICSMMERKIVCIKGGDNSVFIHTRDSKAEEEVVEADRILVNIGLKTNYDFLSNLSLARDKQRIVVDSEMQTSLPGVFACGDAVSYPGKIRLIVTAIGEAATAVESVVAYLKHPARNGGGT